MNEIKVRLQKEGYFTGRITKHRRPIIANNWRTRNIRNTVTLASLQQRRPHVTIVVIYHLT